ncbi:MAG: ABC transporter permease [Spirochaetia bacterium]
MNGTADISYILLAVTFCLLAVPLGISIFFKLGLTKSMIFSVVRMTVQLLLIGIFLRYIFELDNPVINLTWFLLMIFTATVTVIRNSSLNLKLLLLPVTVSFLISGLSVLLFFNTVLLALKNPLTAKYFIAIGGMLLGNALRGNIVGLSTFYHQSKQDEPVLQYRLASGAGLYEAIRPYIREALRRAFAPTVATMATMGIVSLPGMMTGQILGGTEPALAVRYQIAIMIAIFTTVAMGTGISLLLTIRAAFDPLGNLKKEIFKTHS